MQKRSTKPLIRHIHSAIRRGGGGAGYLHNLRLAVDSFRDEPAPIDVQFDFCELQPTAQTKPSPFRIIRRRLGSVARWSGIRKERSFGEQFGQTVQTWKSAAEQQI